MREDLINIAHTVLKFSDSKRLEVGQKYSDLIVEGLQEEGKTEDELGKFYLDLTSLLVCADGYISGSEFSFFKQVTGLDADPEEFCYKTGSGDKFEFVSEMLTRISLLSPKTRSAIVMFGICFLTSDHDLRDDELELLEKMMD